MGRQPPMNEKALARVAKAPAPRLKGSVAARLRKGLMPEGPRLQARRAKARPRQRSADEAEEIKLRDRQPFRPSVVKKAEFLALASSRSLANGIIST